MNEKDIVEQMKKYKRLFLIDGDSFIYKALNGMKQIDSEDKILILVSDEALRSKLIQKGYVRQNVGVVVVKPGKEAVDNRIKGILGNLIKQENRGRIFIISHDHGYYKLINRYRAKYGIQVEMLDLKKSIQAAL